MNELVARNLRAMTNPKLDVVQANDGAEAWRLARQHLPDLVVLDVMMPEMSGWEVCRKIREDVALAHTGVVMLTGIGETLNSLTSPLYGADAYIDKPFQSEELQAKVRETLRARSSQREGIDRPSSTTSLDSLLDKPKPLAKTKGKSKPTKKLTKPSVKKTTPVAVPKKKLATKIKKPAPAKKAVKKSAAKKAVPKTVKKVTKPVKKAIKKVVKKAAKKLAKKSSKKR
jgi:CheY-like chemotaxis protein